MDVAEERDVAGMLVVSIVPLLLLILVFSSVMSIAAESVAGEKERGTMATLLATPIKRRDIALGKVLAITVIGLLIAASSAIGIFSGLPGIMQGSVDINVYGPVEYVLLALVILSTTLVIVALITVVSTLPHVRALGRRRSRAIEERRLVMKMIFKNKHGMVRSGWIIALCMAAFYALGYAFSALLIDALRMILDAASLDAASYDALVDWMSASVLPVALQFLTEGIMLAVPLAAWRIMRYRWEDLGLRDFRARFKKDGVVGMALGFAACSAIFLLLLATGNVVVEGVNSPFSLSLFAWVLVFVAVGIAEEVMNRGFIMSVLRRTNSRFLVIVVPSLIFGLIHLTNPNVTLLSVVNIVLLGIALSLMYYKSGNVWMCIGFHIAWNLFQSVVYGMPVSGLDVPAFLVSAYPVGNLLNGGGFHCCRRVRHGVHPFLLPHVRVSFLRRPRECAAEPGGGRAGRGGSRDSIGGADRFCMERDRFRYRQAPVTFLPSGMMGRMLD